MGKQPHMEFARRNKLGKNKESLAESLMSILRKRGNGCCFLKTMILNTIRLSYRLGGKNDSIQTI